MTTTIPVLFLSLALAITVIVLARERRLRLALQVLLARLLSRWRNHAEKDRDSDHVGDKLSNKRL
jgi:hypothetical protein